MRRVIGAAAPSAHRSLAIRLTLLVPKGHERRGMIVRSTAGLLERGEEIDMVAALHAAVSSHVIIRDQWGNVTQPLFGGFTIDDNPMLRPAAG